MVPKPDVSEERRGQILDVAEKLFAKNGFDGARMDDIAARAGLSKGAIYWYFRKKDDVIAGLLERVFRRNLEGVEAIASDGGTAAQRIRAMVDRIGADYRTLSKLAPIAVDFYALSLRNRGVRTFIGRMYERYEQIFVSLLREGIQSGEFRADLDVKESVAALIAVFEGMGLMWAIDKRFIDWNRTPKAAASLVLEGLLA